MSIAEQVFIFFFGAVIGSFLNAVIWRLRTRESFIVGRSYCPQCRETLEAVDLVPIVSYLMLCGRCRHCRKAIGPQYLWVELAVAAAFLLAARVWPPVAAFGISHLLLAWYAIAILTVVFVYDLRYFLVLRSVTLPATVILALGNLWLGYRWSLLAIGMIVAGGFFWLQHTLSKGRWVGGGDMYIGLLMGAILGWPMVLVALLLAYVSGAAVGLVLLAAKRKQLKSQLPFGPFLAAATLVTLLYGQPLVDWYLGLLL
ncbi:MAG: prepilin peptidase [Patescibacteria group bacterium]|jgi:prepilin signal peptidase PulO-like enzyme (type II secretory pathway)